MYHFKYLNHNRIYNNPFGIFSHENILWTSNFVLHFLEHIWTSTSANSGSQEHQPISMSMASLNCWPQSAECYLLIFSHKMWIIQITQAVPVLWTSNYRKNYRIETSQRNRRNLTIFQKSKMIQNVLPPHEIEWFQKILCVFPFCNHQSGFINWASSESSDQNHQTLSEETVCVSFLVFQARTPHLSMGLRKDCESLTSLDIAALNDTTFSDSCNPSMKPEAAWETW